MERLHRSDRTRWVLTIATTLVLAACQSDESTAPDAMIVDRTGSMGTLIASGAGVLQAAAWNGDSADHAIAVARIEVRGRVGDSVVLAMAGEARVLDGIARRAQFVVRSGTGEDQYAAASALDGITILRLKSAAEQMIEIWLTRDLPPAAKPGAFELRLGGSALFRVVRADWLQPTDSPEAARVSLLDPTMCDVAGATGSCEGVTWTVEPHFPGKPFCGETCFQSAAGTGQSLPINITFSQPVGSVTATIMDPTWSGNTISAIGVDGSTIDQASFAFSGVPGRNIPDTKSVTGVIDRVLLTPAENEYVAYRVSFTPLTAEITVSCGAAERGATATCTATPTAAGATMVLTSWRFQDQSGNVVDRTSSVSTTDWSGTVATSGIVRVNGTVDGVQTFGVAPLTVTSRSWTGKTALKNHTVIPTTLTSTPSAMSGLGDATLSLPLDANMNNWFRTVTDQGPNHDFTYLVGIPAIATSEAQVNTNAITDTSAFYRVQENRRKKIGGVWFCPKSLVTGDLFGLVQAHEGAVPDPSVFPNSHSGIYQRHIDSLAYLQFEVLVGFGGEDRVSPIRASLHASASNDAAAMDTDSRNNITSVSLGCDTFRFTY